LLNVTRSAFAPEDQLLLEACRFELDESRASVVASLVDGGLDWEYLVEAAIRHAVAPLLDHGLAAVETITGVACAVPAPARGALKALHEGSRRRNDRLFGVVEEVAPVLRAAGAEAVALKDLQLAAELYPERGLRPLGDLDLLVRREDWDRAAAALDDLGFEPTIGADRPYARKYAVGQHFRRVSDETWIDLQWNVMQREWDFHGAGAFTYDGEQMWADAVAMIGVDFELRAPRLEDMLFHLCIHAEGHFYSELILLCDIAELVRRHRGSLDWSRLVALGERYGVESSLYHVLDVVRHLLDAPVPGDTLTSLAPPVFDGSLLIPLYGNLGTLHQSLDDARDCAAPQRTLDELEVVVRRQTARAIAAGIELRALAAAVATREDGVATFVGSPSARYFPDAGLPPFAPLHLVVLDRDRQVVEDVLAERGYGEADGRWSKNVPIVSGDPVLAGRPSGLTVTAEITAGLDPVLVTTSESRTNAAAAAGSLKRRLTGRTADDENAQLRVVVHALDPPTLLAALAIDNGRAPEDKVFRACGLVDATRRLSDVPSSADVVELADRWDAGADASLGLAVGAGLTARLDAPVSTRPRVFEWARYGADSVRRYPWLRQAYFVLLSVLMTRGTTARGKYLAVVALGRGRRRPVLLSLLAGAGGGLLRSRGGRGATATDFAYWVEPDTARLVSERRTGDTPERGA
jgi:hypothetical protein